MRRSIATLSLVSLLGCADESGGPSVATDAVPPATKAATPSEVGKSAAGKGISTPSPAPTVGGAAPLQP